VKETSKELDESLGFVDTQTLNKHSRLTDESCVKLNFSCPIFFL